MTPDALMVERDRLLESGRTEEEVEAGQLAMGALTPWQVRCVVAFVEQAKGFGEFEEERHHLVSRLHGDLLADLDWLHEEAARFAVDADTANAMLVEAHERHRGERHSNHCWARLAWGDGECECGFLERENAGGVSTPRLGGGT